METFPLEVAVLDPLLKEIDPPVNDPALTSPAAILILPPTASSLSPPSNSAEPPVPSLDEPALRLRIPALPLVVSPERMVTAPEVPTVPPEPLSITTVPLDVDSLLPLEMCTVPPVETDFPLATGPPLILTFPANPVDVDLPARRRTSPTDALLSPLSIVTRPEGPLLLVPDATITEPLAVSPLAVFTTMLPLDFSAEDPDITVTSPPLPSPGAFPPWMYTLPPLFAAPYTSPTTNSMLPESPFGEFDVDNSILPEAPEAEPPLPVERVISPLLPFWVTSGVASVTSPEEL
mmetsp:Transcript_6414/g.11037  ORF Transcript_6414/g.11037 Transcript_6414/m.11037 type:complete len:291 (+) Transcript_6414:11462-12334(+)